MISRNEKSVKMKAQTPGPPGSAVGHKKQKTKEKPRRLSGTRFIRIDETERQYPPKRAWFAFCDEASSLSSGGRWRNPPGTRPGTRPTTRPPVRGHQNRCRRVEPKKKWR